MKNSKLFKIGLLAESLSEIYLKMKGVQIIGNNDNNKFDLIDRNNITYEVKLDMVAFKTNNIFLEYESFNNASGILTTESNNYIYVLIDFKLNIIQIIQIETQILKDFLNNNQNLEKRSMRAKNIKDETTQFYNRGYIIPITSIIKISSDNHVVNDTDKYYNTMQDILQKIKQHL